MPLHVFSTQRCKVEQAPVEHDDDDDEGEDGESKTRVGVTPHTAAFEADCVHVRQILASGKK
jgi:hypothetical protein